MGVHEAIGGKGGSSGARASEKTSNQALINMAQQFAGETQGIRRELISQFANVLKTGGSQATIPIIGKAVEASKQATSQSLRQLDEELARTGLAGTPFGVAAKGQATTAGNLATSQVPTNIIQQFLQMIPNFILGQGQQAVAGVGAGATNQTQLAQAGMQGIYKSLNLGK